MSEPRLYVEADLAAEREIAVPAAQRHYLQRVLRAGAGAPVRLFNGRHGEWLARLVPQGRQAVALHVERKLWEQPAPPDLWLLFAPVKRGPLDLMVQKATELGATHLQPVMTRRTVPERVKLSRLRLVAVEAAEQCGRLTIPAVFEPMPLQEAVLQAAVGRTLLYADEAGEAPALAAVLAGRRAAAWALLIGPEGGFDPAERRWLRDRPDLTPVSLGPRILRAETAAIVGLAVLQALAGDWQQPA